MTSLTAISLAERLRASRVFPGASGESGAGGVELEGTSGIRSYLTREVSSVAIAASISRAGDAGKRASAASA